jgi:DNA-binding NtrC family response regulator
MLAEIAFSDFSLTCAGRLDEALRCLGETCFDIILLDLWLPDEQGLRTFSRMHEQAPQVPIIVLTGLEDETLALRTVQQGAQDYLVKGQFRGNLLVRAMRYAIQRKQTEKEREKLILQLQEALAKVTTLRGLLPICASCKRIRDDEGYWTQVEVYIREHSEVKFSHGLCPECAKELYPGFYEEDEQS